MASTDLVQGGCLCRAVRYELSAEALDAGRKLCCHCRQCQLTGSSPFLAFATVKTSAVQITGEVKQYPSSKDYLRGFCPQCGTFLTWQTTGKVARL